MADISDVNTTEIKEINDALESLDCEFASYFPFHAQVMTKYSSNHDTHPLLISCVMGWTGNGVQKCGLHSTGVAGVFGTLMSDVILSTQKIAIVIRNEGYNKA